MNNDELNVNLELNDNNISIELQFENPLLSGDVSAITGGNVYDVRINGNSVVNSEGIANIILSALIGKGLVEVNNKIETIAEPISFSYDPDEEMLVMNSLVQGE